MTRHLRAVELWRSDLGSTEGASPRVARLEGDPIRVADLCPAARDHVAAALAGRTSTVRVEREGETWQCTFAPLVAADGSIEGAISTVERCGRDEDALRERLAFEELITTLSTRFVNLPRESIDDELDRALAAIGEHAGVDRAYVFRFTADGTAMDNTHEWCAEGIEPQIHNLQGLEIAVVPWWTSLVKAHQVVHVPSVADLPPEAVGERGVLEAQGVKSVLAIPMVSPDGVMGFVGFDAVRRAKRWPDTDIALLRIAGEIFMNALERARADREREQLQSQLVQARSLENVARLAGGVAHDFNNLLAIILNYAELLRREIREPSQREKLDELFETAQRAAALTRQLLRVGRRDLVDAVPLDVSEVVTSLATLLRQTVGDHVELSLELATDLDVVRVGRPQLEQVVLNLTLNARDAMPRGGTLRVQTENVEITPEQAARHLDLEAGRYVRLRIRDQGTGMASEIAARAFEPFFSTKGAGGTGLGLSSVHGIVKQAGGHVSLASELRVGTTVDVYFPAAAALESRRAPSVPAALAPATPDAPRGRGEVILVVDDSPAIRKLVCTHLRHGATSRSRARPGTRSPWRRARPARSRCW